MISNPMKKLYNVVMSSLLLAALLLPTALHAQSTKTYEGRTDHNNQSYIVRVFDYYIENKDTILNGPYLLESFSKIPDTAKVFTDQHTSIQLEFKKNVPDGDAFVKTFHFFEDGNHRKIEDYNMISSLSGLSIETRGSFKKGQPTGKWETLHKQIEKGRVVENLVLLIVKYDKNGNLTGDFNFNSKPYSLNVSGSFGNDSFIDGKVKIESKQKITLNFDQGLLTGLELNGNKIEDGFSQDAGSNLESVELSKDFVRIIVHRSGLEFKNDSVSKFELENLRDNLSFMVSSFATVTLNETLIQNQMGKSLPKTMPYIRLPRFDYIDGEKEKLEELESITGRMMWHIDTFISHSPFALAAYADKDVAWNIGKLKIIKEQLAKIKKKTGEYQDPHFMYVDRNKYFEDSKGELLKEKLSKKVDFKEEKLLLEIELNYTVDKGYVAAYTEYVEQLIETANDAMTEVAKKVKAKRTEEKLDNLDKDIVGKKEELADLIQDFSQTFYSSGVTYDYMESYNKVMNKLLEKYADAKSVDKISVGKEVMECLDKLIESFENTSKLIEMHKKIHDEYHENELNPVTWTRMEVSSYERLYNAYKDKLIPYISSNLFPGEDKDLCHTFLENLKNYEIVQKFMLDALDDKPSKLNRKIKSGDSVETVIRKLGIELK